MRATLPLLLCAALATTGCARLADSRINPLNWFGSSQSSSVTPTGELRPLVPANRTTKVTDERGPIAQVSALRIESTPDGAIMRATGIASTQGQFNAQLVEVSNSGGVLTFAFRLEAAPGVTAQNSSFSRQVTVAKALSFGDLAGVRTIRVQGANNQRSASR
jgi:hypothetical protein